MYDRAHFSYEFYEFFWRPVSDRYWMVDMTSSKRRVKSFSRVVIATRVTRPSLLNSRALGPTPRKDQNGSLVSLFAQILSIETDFLQNWIIR